MLPYIALALAFATVVVLDAFGKRRHVKAATLLGLGVAAVLLAVPWDATPLVRTDGISIIFSILFLCVSALVIISSKESSAVFSGGVLLSTLGMMLVAAADNALLLYISIELVTVPTYALVAFGKTARRMEAATKYFVVGIVASALLLLGLGLLVLASGTATLSAMRLSPSPFVLLGFVSLLAGLGFKLGIFPFNFWIPDVYSGAPSQVAGLLAAGSKKAAYAALLRLAIVFAAVSAWSMVFAILAAVTMTFATIAAILQRDIRRLLAYSILSQAGFLLIGIAARTPTGYSATVFHAITHSFMALGAFLILQLPQQFTMESLRGFGRSNRLLGASMAIFLLSLAGIPLLSGFASKFYLLLAAADAGLLWLVLLAIINSVIALVFYFGVIRTMFAYPSVRSALHIPRGTLFAICICVAMTILLGVYPQPVLSLISSAVAKLS
jgi:F420H2 dehydrogenase subunit N